MRISDWSSDVCSSDLFLVVPDVQKLASLGITLTDLGNALERNNTSVGGGFVNRNGEGLAVRSDALVRNAGELARTVIATRNGVPITVEQVATVKTGQAIRMGSASENGTEVVVGTAIMRIGENSRVVSTAVAEKLKTINASLPPDVVIQPVLNRRSEEHTSELQSLMRISYAVFCLKKKKPKQTAQKNNTHLAQLRTQVKTH